MQTRRCQEVAVNGYSTAHFSSLLSALKQHCHRLVIAMRQTTQSAASRRHLERRFHPLTAGVMSYGSIQLRQKLSLSIIRLPLW